MYVECKEDGVNDYILSLAPRALTLLLQQLSGLLGSSQHSLRLALAVRLFCCMQATSLWVHLVLHLCTLCQLLSFSASTALRQAFSIF